MKKRTVSLILCLILVFAMIPSMAFAANSSDVSIIKNVEITSVHTPYAGYRPDYGSQLGSTSYTYDDQMEGDPDVFSGKWWYDETEQKVVSHSDTFKLGHVYTFSILLVSTDGYEFWVDNFNTPFIKATVNGEEAVVYDALTGKQQALIEYTFEPCDYNYEISKIEVNVQEPVAGGYPTFDVEILTDAVVKDETESPYYIESVAWYDYKTCTFMNPSDVFEEDGIYEANIMLTTIGDYYFATDNNMADVKAIINGKEGSVGTAGENDRYHIRISRVVFGDIREDVEYVEITDVTAPIVNANPDFNLTPAKDKYYINGVFWRDLTTKTTMKETDVFIAGHIYELEVWVRTNEGYKFPLDTDGFVDVMGLIDGIQADVAILGTEYSAELSVIYTPTSNTISYVDVTEVDAPVVGRTPDYEAFCETKGCNVDTVKWYDASQTPARLMDENETFEAGKTYRVDVNVVAEGYYLFEVDDDHINIAIGTINGEKAITYGSYEDTFVDLGYTFAPCEEDLSKIVEQVEVDGIDAPVAGEIPDYDAICYTPGCEVSYITWYDIAEGEPAVKDPIAPFEAGHTYMAVVTVEALYEYSFLMEDGSNTAVATINGEFSKGYATEDSKIKDFGLSFAPCESDTIPTEPSSPDESERPTDPVVTGLFGDANCDGKVNVKDATLIQKYAASLEELDYKQLILANVNNDANVNVKDATAIQKYVAGLETGLAIGKEI